MMFEIKSANTIIYCEHWEQTRQFYAEVMGLQVRFKREDWFIEFILNDGACLSIADAARCTVKPSGGEGITLSYFIDGLEALYDLFVTRGITPTPIKATSWRAPYFYVFDPEGTRIEFWATKADIKKGN